MKYCVIKNTATVIDGSENSDEVMIKNAVNTGIAESDSEILTEEEYLARKALEPLPILTPSVEERIACTEEAILMLMEVLG